MQATARLSVYREAAERFGPGQVTDEMLAAQGLFKMKADEYNLIENILVGDLAVRKEIKNTAPNQGAWATFTNVSSAIMKPNRYIEQIQRLAEYIVLERRGLTKAQSFHRIAKTHFDYSLKTPVEQYVELVFHTILSLCEYVHGRCLNSLPGLQPV
jgi:hypothetical protein